MMIFQNFNYLSGIGHAQVKVWSMLFLVLNSWGIAAADDEYPEKSDILEFIGNDGPHHGVVFSIMEPDEEALEWVLPRVRHYLNLLHAKLPGLPVSMLSHGDELVSLTKSRSRQYRAMHALLLS